MLLGYRSRRPPPVPAPTLDPAVTGRGRPSLLPPPDCCRCEGYPVSAYVRCKNSVMQAIVQTGMEQFFNPEELMNDP